MEIKAVELFRRRLKIKAIINSTCICLGNLTLVEANINQTLNKVNKITNANWFGGKTKEYCKSDFKLTRSIAEIVKIGANSAWNNFAEKNLRSFTSWSKDEIEKRQELL